MRHLTPPHPDSSNEAYRPTLKATVWAVLISMSLLVSCSETEGRRPERSTQDRFQEIASKMLVGMLAEFDGYWSERADVAREQGEDEVVFRPVRDRLSDRMEAAGRGVWEAFRLEIAGACDGPELRLDVSLESDLAYEALRPAESKVVAFGYSYWMGFEFDDALRPGDGDTAYISLWIIGRHCPERPMVTEGSASCDAIRQDCIPAGTPEDIAPPGF